MAIFISVMLTVTHQSLKSGDWSMSWDLILSAHFETQNNTIIYIIYKWIMDLTETVAAEPSWRGGRQIATHNVLLSWESSHGFLNLKLKKMWIGEVCMAKRNVHALERAVFGDMHLHNEMLKTKKERNVHNTIHTMLKRNMERNVHFHVCPINMCTPEVNPFMWWSFVVWCSVGNDRWNGVSFIKG